MEQRGPDNHEQSGVDVTMELPLSDRMYPKGSRRCIEKGQRQMILNWLGLKS